MFRKLWCWIVGTNCAWKTTHSTMFVRGATGVYVNVAVPQIKVQVHYQTCATCGKVRTQECDMGPL